MFHLAGNCTINIYTSGRTLHGKKCRASIVHSDRDSDWWMKCLNESCDKTKHFCDINVLIQLFVPCLVSCVNHISTQRHASRIDTVYTTYSIWYKQLYHHNMHIQCNVYILWSRDSKCCQNHKLWGFISWSLNWRVKHSLVISVDNMIIL